ncbi:response regulator transcription factor [Streptomyces sp. NPDC004232]|uniref:response regulator transcription factor n=1 Tax=Streptomyces sp. NPDC004232 TaxID=3154454 RepID=UPI0033B3D232
MSTISPQGHTDIVRPDGTPVRVLVVDDDPRMLELLTTALGYEGWTVRGAQEGRGAIKAAREFRPDAVVLDVMLPDMDGLDVLAQLRSELSEVLILLLSSTSQEDSEERFAGLTAGSDDYITKPFSLEKVVARLGELMRQAGVADSRHDSVLVVGDLALNEDSQVVTRGGDRIHLTSTEFELLRFLMRHAEEVLSEAQILDEVWAYDFGSQANLAKRYISYLKCKIEAGREPMIHTRDGDGFLITPAVRS